MGEIQTGYVSALQIYQIMMWLESGYKINPINGYVPKKEKKYIIEHFSLEYSKEKRRYTNTHKHVFEIFKNDYPNVIESNKITSYTQLLSIATR